MSRRKDTSSNEGRRSDSAPDVARENGPSPYLICPLVLLAVLIGLYFCVAGRGDVHLFGDEFHSVWRLNASYGELFKNYDRYGSGIVLPLIQRFAVDVFGPGLWSYRFPAFLGAIATLLIVYPAASCLVGRTPAVIASLALAANSMHIFYSRFGRAYALTIFFAVLVVYAVTQAMRETQPRPFWYAIFALSAGLLPCVHLSAATFAVGIGIAALVTMSVRKQTRRHRRWLVGSLAAGAVICLGLHVRAWESLQQYLSQISGRGDLAAFGVLDVLSLLAGSRTAGMVWLVCVPAATAWFVLRKRSAALILIAAVFVPAVSLMITQPYGMAYAYARYLLMALPFMLMLLAWLVVELACIARFRTRTPDAVGLSVGLALVLASFVAGPLGLRHTDDGPFANTYLSMMPLPAFDVAWEETPAFYKTLADSDEPIQIIETPELLSRSVQLYRNYYLQHRKRVIVGLLSVEPKDVPAGPYVSIKSTESIKRSGADYLILHRDLVQELASYWQFVYEKVWPDIEDAGTASLMKRQETYWARAPNFSPDILVSRFTNSFGAPTYQDHMIIVWKLKP